MKVKDVILKAAAEIGVLEQATASFAGGTANTDKETATLLRCFNLVENEVALDYLPLRAEDILESPLGVVRFAELSNTPARILSVTDEWGNPLKFKLFPDFLKTQAGKIVVLYTYSPKEKTADEDSDFSLFVGERALAFGVCAEYFLACGLYEQAAVWDAKYKDALKAAMRSQKNRVISSRRWA